MPSLSSVTSRQASIFQFSSALSRKPDTEAAARDLADDTRAKLSGAPVDLACLFLSSHHLDRAELLVNTLSESLCPRLMIGCTGEGIIAGREELETAPAVTLWTASLPGVT